MSKYLIRLFFIELKQAVFAIMKESCQGGIKCLKLLKKLNIPILFQKKNIAVEDLFHLNAIPQLEQLMRQKAIASTY